MTVFMADARFSFGLIMAISAVTSPFSVPPEKQAYRCGRKSGRAKTPQGRRKPRNRSSQSRNFERSRFRLLAGSHSATAQTNFVGRALNAGGNLLLSRKLAFYEPRLVLMICPREWIQFLSKVFRCQVPHPCTLRQPSCSRLNGWACLQRRGATAQ